MEKHVTESRTAADDNQIFMMSETDLVRNYFAVIPQDMMQLPPLNELQSYLPQEIYSSVPSFDDEKGMSEYIGLHVLLSKKVQLQLGKLMDFGRVARMYLDNPTQYSLEELTAIDALGTRAREVLIMTHTRLAYGQAEYTYHRNNPRIMSVEDLYAEGLIGLIKATYKYDWRRGHKFTTYANFYINHMLKKAVPEQDHIMTTPSRQYHRANQMFKKATREDIDDGNIAAICRDTGFSETSVKGLLAYIRTHRTLELDKPSLGVDGKERETLADRIPAGTSLQESVESSIVMRESMEFLKRALSPRDYDIICMLSGHGYDRVYKLSEIGRKYSLTGERIRQIRKDIQERVTSSQKEVGVDTILDVRRNI